VVDALAGSAIFFDSCQFLGHCRHDTWRAVKHLFYMIRVLRLLKLLRHVEEMRLIQSALAKEVQAIVVFLGTVMVFLVTLGTAIWCIEPDDSGFDSIPISIWWAAVTLTTVGYGDMTPATPLGKCLATVVMLLGYSILAVPTILGILGTEKAFGKKDEDISENLRKLVRHHQRRHTFSFAKRSCILEDGSSKSSSSFVTQVTIRPGDLDAHGFLHAVAALQLMEAAATAFYEERASWRSSAACPRISTTHCSCTVLERLPEGSRAVEVGLVVEEVSVSSCAFRLSVLPEGIGIPCAVGELQHSWYVPGLACQLAQVPPAVAQACQVSSAAPSTPKASEEIEALAHGLE